MMMRKEFDNCKINAIEKRLKKIVRKKNIWGRNADHLIDNVNLVDL